MNLEIYLQERACLIETTLREILPKKDAFPTLIHESMHYSVFAGGKRLRPILCLAAVEAIGRDFKPLLPIACALEMIHTYSLIHDDLPAMDDDDYRRGKLTNHKVYGEGVAILAGDALLTYAFEVLAKYGLQFFSPQIVCQVMQEIALAVGTKGMIGGQVADLMAAEQGKKDKNLLIYIHTHKTGALFRAALRTGALLAGATTTELVCLTTYAEKFGLAFQITDDLLDLTGNSEKLGKTVGSDQAMGKLTFPALYGIEKSRELVQEVVDEALQTLAKLPGETKPLELLLQYLVVREV